MRRSVAYFASTILAAALVYACAIDPGPFFSTGLEPEQPKRFLNGQLGILTPDLAPVYELLAFRALSGLPIDGVSTTWQDAEAGGPEGTGDWLHARSSVNDPKAPKMYLDPDRRLTPSYVSYPNCLPDAFATAARTLTDRQHQYGDQNLFRDWVSAQDQVFEDCSAEQPVFPAEPAAKLPALARADRMYQIAAAHFYAQDFGPALDRFRVISEDKQSPWSKTAAYMIGRVYLRQLSLQNASSAAQSGRAQLEKIANDPAFGSLQSSARGLLLRLDALQNPSHPLHTLGEQFMSHQADAAVSDALRQAQYILRANTFEKALEQPGVPDAFDWVKTLERNDAAHATERWRSLHTPPWLTLALIEATGTDGNAADLLNEAGRVAPADPGFATTSYNAIRLRIERGQVAEARAQVDEVLRSNSNQPATVLNGWRAERMRVAVDFDDFLRWAPRTPVPGIEIGDPDASPVLAPDSVQVLNFQTPLAKLALASHSAQLPAWTRDDVALSAWTRAFLLNDAAILRDLAAALSAAHPNWKGQFEPPPGSDEYPAWKFRTALLVARHSDFRPTLVVDYRKHVDGDDWWCATEPPAAASAANGPEMTVAWRLPAVFRAPDNVLPPPDARRAGQEVEALKKTGSAQAFLGPIILDWAHAHPGDKDVPEALYRLVRIVRYGCARGDAGNGKYSKAAFDLLHSRYPGSEWTRKTPYWFE